MRQTSTKYHIALADYFNTKSLYLDEKNNEKPNTRKLVEQPWQQIKAKKWEKVPETLCDLYFIQAKYKAGMTHDLAKNFRIGDMQCLKK